ncbi:hypothetical protein [Nocardioides sp. LHG3406-4]|uniref:hypothetical protein n=1 Tax=Nocardioides sp. LHG3406-4 TaxID=2804575 RepID=UPI003CF106A0
MSSYRPHIRNEYDLERAWRIIAPPQEPRPHSLWIMLIGEGRRAFTQLTQVEDAFTVPPPESGHVLPDFVRELVDAVPAAVERIAFLRTRPGHFGPTNEDLAWAECLYAVAGEVALRCETVFLATDLVLVPMPPAERSSLVSA